MSAKQAAVIRRAHIYALDPKGEQLEAGGLVQRYNLVRGRYPKNA